ncbi:putative catalase-peroxidase [Gordonia rhizosphera NBRC 16068]|uniref:catalase peroxidase n=1 Tax=Gordonia rhizosphera NBRC 16068 TaxID=1108045 RepID=K6WGU0_9ACTN|nr:putative catalase-peroxidase [Gordonia rhizosphera NBRC 16068]
MITERRAVRNPAFEKITRRWLDHPEELAEEFAKAWFKLLHRDMGPAIRYRGPLVPTETYVWQDNVPAQEDAVVSDADVASLKAQILASGLTVPQLVSTAWKAAATFRGSDFRGGANGGRIRLQPQLGWESNETDDLAQVIAALEQIQKSFNGDSGTKVSFADLVVLGGVVAVEKAAKDAGIEVSVPFTPGRTDASQESTDVESFAHLEPAYDGFRNYEGKGNALQAEYNLVDKANLLTLTAPEMTVLVGGLRVLGANHGNSTHGVLTENVGQLTNDFFVNILDMDTVWATSPSEDGTYVGKDRSSGADKWTGTRVDLVFAANSELRALAEVYAEDDAKEAFVTDFVAAWTKVSELDRYDRV